MGAICTLLDKTINKRSGTYSPAQWLIDFFTGDEESASGVRVNENNALKYTPFWSAVRIISGTLAALPSIVYQRTDTGWKRRAQEHPIYEIVHERPNEYIDAMTFFESRQAHVLTYGNGFAEIQRDGSGRPIALWPLLPNKTWRRAKDGVLFYEIEVNAGQRIPLPDYNVLHIKGLGFDGYTGYNVVQYHKEAIGYGKAVKEYGARFFGNGANVGGTLEHPDKISDEAMAHLKESLKLEYEGLSKAHRMMILEEGMKMNKTGVDPEQAQALQVQKWNVDDCSNIFTMPPYMLGSMEHSKYNNVEHLGIEFYCRTMLYWFRKWEQEINYKLFMPSERGKYFYEILADGLVRGDLRTRYNAYNIGRNAGFLCVDDIREKENMNPLPDGKGQIFLEPLNMKPAGSPGPKDDDQSMNDDVRTAHRELLTAEWQRIITRQVNALAKGANGDFYDGQRDYAAKILFKPVNIWAAINNVSPEDARAALYEMIAANVNKDKRFEISDCQRLADMTMTRIGGKNVF